MKQICARVSFLMVAFGLSDRRSCRGQAADNRSRLVGLQAARCRQPFRLMARFVVFTVQEWSVEKNKSTSNLWLAEIATGKVRRLTRANASDGAPAWSPDGARIAFVSKRGEDETGGLYVIEPRGGEAEKIVELPYSVTGPKWMPDSKRVVVATTRDS